MKTSERMISPIKSRPSLKLAMALVLLGGLLAQSSLAQGGRRGESRNSNPRDISTRQNTGREQNPRMQGSERRNDQVVNRSNRSGEFNRPQPPVKADRNNNAGWNHDNNPVINNNRNTVRVCNSSNRFKIRNIKSWITNSFEINRFSFGVE